MRGAGERPTARGERELQSFAASSAAPRALGDGVGGGGGSA